jgi:predicted Zn finger-like uncharacterized protein
LVVICPKCKTKLKVAEEKLTPGGSRFKCPKCSAVLLVKKPLPAPEKPVEGIKILVAHSNPAIANEIVSLLKKKGYGTITASDGIETMVKAMKELPAVAIVEVGLPKIYGFEVCKRLKLRPETKRMKFILVNSVYDKDRYKREPESFYGADDYIEEHLINELLIDSIHALTGKEPAGKKEEDREKTSQPLSPEPLSKDKIALKEEPRPQPKEEKAQPSADEKIERARRLARTIISDIYLYNTAKADEAIRNDTFYSAFAPEIKEGLKLYDNRIAREVRALGDFFQEALSNFIEGKKKIL